MSKLPILWEEYHYVHMEKDKDWKWSVGIVSGTLAILGFMLGSLTFGFLIIISTLVLLIQALRPPQILRFELNESGIRVEQEKWTYKDIKSFWIEDNREHHLHSRILFRTDEMWTPLVIFPLPIETDQNDLHDIRAELLTKLKEEKLHESFFQRLLENFGF